MTIEPSVNRAFYKQNPLVLVLAQVQYPVLPEFSDGHFVQEFLSAVVGEYPIVNRFFQNATGFPDPFVSLNLSAALYRATSMDQSWSLVVGESSLTLEARRYSSFEELLARFSKLIDAVMDIYDVRIRTRLALRYVNEFRLPAMSSRTGNSIVDWRGLLHEDLLGLPVHFAESLDCDVRIARQDFAVTIPDGALVVRHGLLSGTSVERIDDLPPPVDPAYLLDLDRADTQICDLSAQSVKEGLERFHESISRVFRWAITDTQHLAMEPEGEH